VAVSRRGAAGSQDFLMEKMEKLILTKFCPSSGALDCVYSCKHSLVLLRMREIIPQNMLS